AVGCGGEPPLLETGHHPAESRGDAARNDRDSRRARFWIRAGYGLHPPSHGARGVRLVTGFTELLRNNRNYRYTWAGQLVSEIGDHFNNVAVFSLVLATTKSGLVVSGVMLSRAIPAMLAGPLAGVVLDRLDRKRVMI